MKFSFAWIFHLVILFAISLEYQVYCGAPVTQASHTQTGRIPQPSEKTIEKNGESQTHYELAKPIPETITLNVPKLKKKQPLRCPKSNLPLSAVSINEMLNGYEWIKPKIGPDIGALVSAINLKMKVFKTKRRINDYMDAIRSDVGDKDRETFGFPSSIQPRSRFIPSSITAEIYTIVLTDCLRLR